MYSNESMLKKMDNLAWNLVQESSQEKSRKWRAFFFNYYNLLTWSCKFFKEPDIFLGVNKNPGGSSSRRSW